MAPTRAVREATLRPPGATHLPHRSVDRIAGVANACARDGENPGRSNQHANIRWLRRPGPWPGAEAVTVWVGILVLVQGVGKDIDLDASVARPTAGQK